MTKRSAGRDLALIPEEFQEIATLCAATDVLIGGRTVIGVADARQLHAGLSVGRDFTNWIKGRIEKFGFRDGVDFERVAAKETCSPDLASNKETHGGHNAVTYRLTLDMAKELAMVENNEMGRLIRRYYIWLEEARTVPAPSFDASTLGGIVKAVVGKQIKDALTELAPQIIAAQLAADPRIAAVDAVPALQVAIDAKVPKAGRRPIVKTISDSLSRHSAERGHIVRRDARGTKLFAVNAVNEWRLQGGDSLIRKLVAANTSAGPLFAIPGGKH